MVTLPANRGCHAEPRAVGESTPVSPGIGKVSMTTTLRTGMSLMLAMTAWYAADPPRVVWPIVPNPT